MGDVAVCIAMYCVALLYILLFNHVLCCVSPYVILCG